MVDPPLIFSRPFFLSLVATISQHVPNLPDLSNSGQLVKRSHEPEKHDAAFIAGIILMPILVILSGIFAGLTLGYMSLDETQLHVLSISGTPQQRKYANQIKPIRQNGHLLLVTLLLANMIVNESLPVISDPLLGGGVQSVIVSTVLIVIFSEIIPQSICTRHGLYVGAKMVGVVRVLLWTLGIIAWPIAKILEFTLGPHHGIIYRRAELKELIALHSSVGEYGGDLRSDTITIIGATLDLQEKTTSHAMTKIENVFMLSINARLDFETLREVCATGHSRVPVYEEIELPAPDGQTVKAKKIVGVLLVKQCLLLDPGDAIPVRSLPLHKVPCVAQNEPLLGILDKFQEGRSHMAIVTRTSVEKASSLKKAVKKSITQRIKSRVGISDSSSDDSDDEPQSSRRKPQKMLRIMERSDASEDSVSRVSDRDGTLVSEGTSDKDEGGRSFSFRRKRKRNKKQARLEDVEMGIIKAEPHSESEPRPEDVQSPSKRPTLVQFALTPGLEQSMPADAVLTKEGANEFLLGFDPYVDPLGIITLEDVLEELIGEEIYDEFDTEGARHGEVTSYVPPQSNSTSTNPHIEPSLTRKGSAPELSSCSGTSGVVHSPPQSAERSASVSSTPILRPIAIPALKGLSFLTGRSRSMPPIPRDHKRSPSARSSALKAGDDKQKQSVSTFGYIRADEKPSEPMSAPPLDLPATPAPAYLPLPVPGPPTPDVSINDTARVRPGATAVSHSSSPTPSLSEALLRARRPATPHTPGSSQSKGTRFKSNITGVADHVLRLGEHYQHPQTHAQTCSELKDEHSDGVTNEHDSGGAGDGPETQGKA